MIKTRIKLILILIIYLFINSCHASGLSNPVGARPAAMGRTSVCERGIWSVYNNPSGLSNLKGWQFGLYYENQWLLKETAFKSGGVTKAFDGIGCFGLSISQLGWSDHSENLLGLAYARSFGPHLAMGLRADCWWLHQGEGYRDGFAPGFTLGVQSQVTDKLLLGVLLINPVRSRLNTVNDNRLPVVMRLGCSYRFTEDFVGQCEVEKDSQIEGVRLGSGFEYTLFDRFQLRAGAQYHPNIISFGVGCALARLQLDVAAQMHQELGASLQISMQYAL